MRSLSVAGFFVFMMLTIGATLAPPAFCAAPNWFELDDNMESTFFYDRNGTTKPKEGVVRVVTRVVYSEEGKAEALKVLSKYPGMTKLFESRYVHDLDCGEKESRLLSASHLAEDGTVLRSTDLSSVTEAEAIPPETRMWYVLLEACGL